MRRALAIGLGVAGCGAEGPPAVDWCAVRLPVPVAARVPADAGLIYEIYVRSFQDTDGDGVGDLPGVTAHLDYLAGLGVSTLWLMPVFASSGGAGYAPTDWGAVEPDYGTAADLDDLLAAARARGMRVILDAPLNHTSDAHPWFQAALADKRSPAVFDYLFSGHQWDDKRWVPTDDGRFYYAYFGAAFPDLDLTRPGLAQRLAAALNGWLDAGVGGFREDAVVQLIEEGGAIGDTDGSHCLLAWLTAQLHAAHPDALLLSEAWSKDPAQNLGWLGEDQAPEADLILDVPRRWASIEAWGTGDPGPIADALQAQIDGGASDKMASYLSGQDVRRTTVELPDDRMRRSAMVLHLLGPGEPILYYGDELDMPSARDDDGPDEPQRAPMLWDDTYNAGFSDGTPWFSVDQRYRAGFNAAAEADDPDSMLSFVTALAELRTHSAAARSGQTTLLETGHPAVFALERSADAEGLVVAVNYSPARKAGITVTLPADLGSWTDLSTGAPLTGGGKILPLPDLPPYGYAVLGTAALEPWAVPAPADTVKTPL